MLTKRHLLTHLISCIASLPTPPAPGSNPLRSFTADKDTKNLFYTLHVLFPQDLLSALDLLDRGQVQRLLLASPLATAPIGDGHDPAQHPPPAPGPQQHRSERSLYLVSSSLSTQKSNCHPNRQGRHGHGSTFASSSIASRLQDDAHEDDDGGNEGLDEAARHHLVRVETWSCSCPGFAFSLFPAWGHGGRDGGDHDHGSSDLGMGDEDVGRGRSQGKEWVAGGFLRGEQTPMCKHLMASLLVERCQNLFGGFAKERELSVDEWVGWEAGYGG
ncbi:hypothetical protein CAC42_1274 [Sphaceloma murrayae]|uniref:Uncharacterized protein n=1 Tax=Sphaceloma murrayae TaxID=2082308 RepID=A0A2K1R2I7_9PEZI|nr:hypothetical protein CAC42_1274 [Sphaceloma murrayae]